MDGMVVHVKRDFENDGEWLQTRAHRVTDGHTEEMWNAYCALIDLVVKLAAAAAPVGETSA